MQREFTGVFIPKEIWESKDLCPLEKMLLAEIDCLSKVQGCYADNAYLSDSLQVSERRLQQMLMHLKSAGLLIIEFQNKKRFMWVKYISLVQTDVKLISQETKDISQPLHIIETKKERKVFFPQYFPLCVRMRDAIKRINSEFTISEESLHKWEKDFEAIVRLDGKTVQQIIDKIDAVFQPGEFWGSVIRCPAKLRIRWKEGRLPGVIQIRKQQEQVFENPAPANPDPNDPDTIARKEFVKKMYMGTNFEKTY